MPRRRAARGIRRRRRRGRRLAAGRRRWFTARGRRRRAAGLGPLGRCACQQEQAKPEGQAKQGLLRRHVGLQLSTPEPCNFQAASPPSNGVCGLAVPDGDSGGLARILLQAPCGQSRPRWEPRSDVDVPSKHGTVDRLLAQPGPTRRAAAAHVDQPCRFRRSSAAGAHARAGVFGHLSDPPGGRSGD